jgi:hypothetical protein
VPFSTAGDVTESFIGGGARGAKNSVKGAVNTVVELGKMGADTANDLTYIATGHEFYHGKLSGAAQALASGQMSAGQYYGETGANVVTFGVYGQGKALVQLANGEITVDQASEQVGGAAIFQAAGAYGMARARASSPTAPAEPMQFTNNPNNVQRLLPFMEETPATTNPQWHGPGIGRSGYKTSAEFADAAYNQYQRLYNQGDAVTRAQVAAGTLANDPVLIGSVIDDIARTGMRAWVAGEGLSEGANSIIAINRYLRDPSGSGAYRIPDVRIPSANLIMDGTIGLKTRTAPQVIDFGNFSGGNNVMIVRPDSYGGSYGIVR